MQKVSYGVALIIAGALFLAADVFAQRVDPATPHEIFTSSSLSSPGGPGLIAYVCALFLSTIIFTYVAVRNNR